MYSLNRLVSNRRTLFWGHATGNSFGQQNMSSKLHFMVTRVARARVGQPYIWMLSSVTINDGALGAIETLACRWLMW
jgi:hypothetical protein